MFAKKWDFKKFKNSDFKKWTFYLLILILAILTIKDVYELVRRSFLFTVNFFVIVKTNMLKCLSSFLFEWKIITGY